MTPLVYQAAKRLREARLAVAGLEAGTLGQGARGLAARCTRTRRRCCCAACGNTSQAALRAATCAVADLEWWTRGGSDYPDDVALALAVARASGARDG